MYGFGNLCVRGAFLIKIPSKFFFKRIVNSNFGDYYAKFNVSRLRSDEIVALEFDIKKLREKVSHDKEIRRPTRRASKVFEKWTKKP